MKSKWLTDDVYPKQKKIVPINTPAVDLKANCSLSNSDIVRLIDQP